MRTSQAINHFKTRAALARALGITGQAISQWGETVPQTSAWKLQVLTGGLLVVDERLYRRRNTNKRQSA